MPSYPVRCTVCGKAEDQIHRMPPGDELPKYDPCACGGEVARVFTPIAEVRTGNRMHHVVDRTLMPGFGPVEFKTRGEWESAMNKLGVRPAEPGDAAAQVRNEICRSEECRRKQFKETEARADRAIEKALAQIGGM